MGFSRSDPVWPVNMPWLRDSVVNLMPHQWTHYSCRCDMPTSGHFIRNANIANSVDSQPQVSSPITIHHCLGPWSTSQFIRNAHVSLAIITDPFQNFFQFFLSISVLQQLFDFTEFVPAQKPSHSNIHAKFASLKICPRLSTVTQNRVHTKLAWIDWNQAMRFKTCKKADNLSQCFSSLLKGNQELHFQYMARRQVNSKALSLSLCQSNIRW